MIAVANGEEAWNAVQQFQPEIALMDGLMPKADGREISKRIKEDTRLKTKTVIMTSLYTSAAQRDEAFRKYRVDGYLAKPVRSEVLKDTLAGLLPQGAEAHGLSAVSESARKLQDKPLLTITTAPVDAGVLS